MRRGAVHSFRETTTLPFITSRPKHGQSQWLFTQFHNPYHTIWLNWLTRVLNMVIFLGFVVVTVPQNLYSRLTLASLRKDWSEMEDQLLVLGDLSGWFIPRLLLVAHACMGLIESLVLAWGLTIHWLELIVTSAIVRTTMMFDGCW